MATTTSETTVTPLKGFVTKDCDVHDRYAVRRPGRPEHVVTVRITPDMGTPQDETCDCKGFKFRRTCAHIDAVYEAGVLGHAPDWE